MNLKRCRRLSEQAIERFGLDLSGLVVLTEAATGYFALTPVIAGLAGAEQVLALARDTRYGSAETAVGEVMDCATAWRVCDRIRPITDREAGSLRRVRLATNLGAVRPLNRNLIKRLAQDVVVSLMFETWEYRQEELDLEYCRQKGVPVAGTNEHHPLLGIFDFLGPLAGRLLLEMDIELHGARVAVFGGDEFALPVVRWLIQSGADVYRAAGRPGLPVDTRALTGLDAVVVAEHRSEEMLIGPGGVINAHDLAEISPGLVLAHISGAVDLEEIKAAGIPVNPSKLAPPRHMSVSTAYVGPRPLIDLHAAGLKVGQALAEARGRGLRGKEAEQSAARHCELVQLFEF